MAPTPKPLTTTQAAQYFRVGNSTLLRWVEEGKVPAHRGSNGRLTFVQAEIQEIMGGIARLLTSLEVARIFRVHVATVNKWGVTGLLTCRRTPGDQQFRYDFSEITARLDGAKRLLRAREAAQVLGIKVDRLWSMAATGKIPIIHLPAHGYRFDKAKIMAIARERRQNKLRRARGTTRR